MNIISSAISTMPRIQMIIGFGFQQLDKIIHDIWKKKQRVTHRDFMDCLNKIHPSYGTITKPTFTEILCSVHEKTGFLNSFKIVNQSYHGNGLPDEEIKKIAILNSYCDKEVRQSCGDTQGQLLSLWRLGTLVGLNIRARFRAVKNVNLYKSPQIYATA